MTVSFSLPLMNGLKIGKFCSWQEPKPGTEPDQADGVEWWKRLKLKSGVEKHKTQKYVPAGTLWTPPFVNDQPTTEKASGGNCCYQNKITLHCSNSKIAERAFAETSKLNFIVITDCSFHSPFMYLSASEVTGIFLQDYQRPLSATQLPDSCAIRTSP